ncbi:hypothetical protein niasHT_032034 [Heterodera trifolii]|uniref:Uncharacterized protein n=2 Tax=Heterodera trifolii TaxID=157864 RepID=A0ABD2I976_9BILA
MADASSNVTEISSTAIFVAYAMAFLELGTLIPTIPILAFCSSIVYKTSILHRNLKGILLAQLFGIFMSLWPRVFLLVDKVFVAKKFFLLGPNFISGASMAAMTFNNIAGHVLIVERMCATVYVNTYERYSSWAFTVVWLSITLNENIRTGRQLAPNFLCHFIIVFTAFVVAMNYQFGIIASAENMLIFFQAVYLVHAVINLALPVAMLCYHPLLNRKAKMSLVIIKKFVTNSSVVSPNEGTAAQPLDTDGRPFSERIQQENQDKEAYFKQLASAWGDRA